MFSFFTTDTEKRDNIINFFNEKGVKFFYTEQYTLFKTFEYFNSEIIDLKKERSFVYLFEWKDKRIKTEHLMAL